MGIAVRQRQSSRVSETCFSYGGGMSNNPRAMVVTGCAGKEDTYTHTGGIPGVNKWV